VRTLVGTLIDQQIPAYAYRRKLDLYLAPTVPVIAMIQKVMLCRLVWAEKYDSKKEKIFPGNMRYPAAHNFARR
jgi:hypothetical protein